MNKGKHYRVQANKLISSKIILMSIALSLVLFSIIGGTVAWLIAKTEPVVNTFTYGDINITLEETDTNKDGDGDPNTNLYPMMPGNTITKDPLVTVIGGSENSWLFVKLEKSANFDEFMTYEIADGWTPLEGFAGVYYREVDKTAADTEFEVIKGNEVTVKADVTKGQLNALDKNADGTYKAEADRTYPTLTVTAYAVQRDTVITSAADAWSKIVNP